MSFDVTIEIAPGADPDAAPGTWTWVDISDYVYIRNPIIMERGRRDHFATTAPAQISLTANNAGGRFVARNPLGPYYPLLRRGCPLRVTVEGSIRATAFIDSLPAEWDISGRDAYATITAGGRLKRVGRSSTPLKSTMTRTLSYDDPVAGIKPVAYWPLEDGTYAGTMASGVLGGYPMHVSTVAGLSAATPPPGSAPVVQMSNRGFMVGSISGGTTGGFTAACILRWPTPDTAAGCAAWEIRTSGSLHRWQIISNGSVIQVAYKPYNGAQVTLSTAFNPYDDTWHAYVLTVAQDGSDVDVTLNIDEDGQINTTVVGQSVGKPTSVYVSSESAPSAEETPAIGHLAIYSPSPGNVLTSNLMKGYEGEQAHARIYNLCREEGIPTVAGMLSGASAAMGPQPMAPLLAVLRDAEATDGGILLEARTGEIDYIRREELYNRTVDLALDYAAGHVAPPFQPLDDDTNLVNDVTASKPGATSARYVDLESVALDGRREDSISVNPQLDDSLLDHASWRAHLGTVDEQRYPALSLRLHTNATLIAPWLTCEIGSRITVDNLPGELPPDLVDLHLEGYTETVDPFAWTVQAHCSPARPYDVGIWDSDMQGKADTAGSVVAATVTAGATAIDLATTAGPSWTTNDAEFPFDLAIGGERVTVTDIAASAITYGAVGTVAHANNASVTPGMPTGITAGNLLLCLAAIRNSGAGHPNTPAGWVRLPPFDAADNVRIMGKIAVGGDTAPTVTFAGGVAGADTTAQVIRVAGKFYDVNRVVHRSASALNASGQNIAYPGLSVWENNALVLYLGWKQDDWTSVVSPGTEIAEPATTTGDDQGLVWAYQIQTTRAHVAPGVFTVTGGVSAISRGAVLAIRCDRQAATVTRAANGVSKAQTVGTAVRLWTPSIMAL